MQCTDVQHSAFLTSASPSAHHINQNHWGTSNQPFRQLPHVHWSPLCLRTGLKKHHSGTSGFPGGWVSTCHPVKCWLCSVGDGSSSITADCVPLHCVGFSAYSFASFQSLTQGFPCRVCTSGGDFRKKYNFQCKQLWLSVFGWTHVILPCSNRNTIHKVIMSSQALQSGDTEFCHLRRALLNHLRVLNSTTWKTLFCYEPLKDFILYILGEGLSNASSPEASPVMGMHMPWLQKLMFLVLSLSTHYSTA